MSRVGSVIICPPGPLATWCYGIIDEVASLTRMAVYRFDRTDTIDPVANPGLYLCEYPSLAAITAIQSGSLAAVLMLQDPVWSVAGSVANRLTLLEALRSYSASSVANLAIGQTSVSRLVFPHPSESAGIAARKVLIAAGLPAGPDTLQKIAPAIAPDGATDMLLGQVVWQISGKAPPPLLSETDRRVITQVTAGTLAMAQGDRSYPVIWPTQIYFSGDRPNEPAAAVADVTGPSRVMIYGPYLHLPPCTYMVEVIISFEGRIDDIPFLLEFWAAEHCLERLRLDGRKSGGYRGRFEMTVSDPVAPIEVRLRNERGSIEGAMSLTELRFFAQDVAAKDFS